MDNPFIHAFLLVLVGDCITGKGGKQQQQNIFWSLLLFSDVAPLCLKSLFSHDTFSMINYSEMFLIIQPWFRHQTYTVADWHATRVQRGKESMARKVTAFPSPLRPPNYCLRKLQYKTQVRTVSGQKRTRTFQGCINFRNFIRETNRGSGISHSEISFNFDAELDVLRSFVVITDIGSWLVQRSRKDPVIRWLVPSDEWQNSVNWIQKKSWNCIKSDLKRKEKKLTSHAAVWTFLVVNLRTDIETWWHILKVMEGATPGCIQNVRVHPNRGSEAVSFEIGSNLTSGEFTLHELALDFTPNVNESKDDRVRFWWVHPHCHSKNCSESKLRWCHRWYGMANYDILSVEYKSCSFQLHREQVCWLYQNKKFEL